MSNQTLTQYLRELRQSHNYSQQAVSSYLHISRQTYSHYETGRITPPAESLYLLAQFYDIPIGNLLELSVTGGSRNKTELRKTDSSQGPTPEELSAILNYSGQPENKEKYRLLNMKEKELLYFYQLLDPKEQEDLLLFMKIKGLRKKPL